jgi:ribonuclease HI
MELSAPTPPDRPRPSPITAMTPGGDPRDHDSAAAVVRVSPIHRINGDVTLGATVFISDRGDIAVNRLLTAEQDNARARRTLTLDAFAEVHRWAEQRDRRTSVYVTNVDVRRELTAVAESFPQVRIAQNLYDGIGRRLAPVYEQAGAAVAAHRRTVRDEDRWMTVYTDASVSLGNQGAGLAAVTEDGRVRSAWVHDVPGSPTLAELLAIEMAVSISTKNHLRIRTDCQRALRLLGMTDPELGAATSKDLAAAVRRIHVATHGRKVKLEWVQGHGDDIFNDAADRLARTVRRYSALGIDQSVLDGVLANIRAELAARMASQAAGPIAA